MCQILQFISFFSLKILIVDHGTIPALLYGGTERVIWNLGKQLVQRGFEVTYLVNKGSYCDFAQVLIIDNTLPLLAQIPKGFDLVHFQFQPESEPDFPYLVTNHGNRNHFEPFLPNTVFVSKNHASRYGSTQFVYNGLDVDEYPMVKTENPSHFHFLGNAAWRVKNLRGAIEIVKSIPGEKLYVLGGNRFNFKMGIRLTLHPRIKFAGMVGGKEKLSFIQKSKGLIFPILWHEPFGLAIIESMFCGKPVFGTPYGSLPELVISDAGALSSSASELASFMKSHASYQPQTIRDYAASVFNASKMADNYIQIYNLIVNGEKLHSDPPILVKVEPKFLPWNSL